MTTFDELRRRYPAREIDPTGRIEDPVRFVAGVIRRHFGSRVSAQSPYEEIFHEGVVGLYAYLSGAEGYNRHLPADMVIRRAWGRVMVAIATFLDQPDEVTFSTLKQAGDEWEVTDLPLSPVNWGEISDLSNWRKSVVQAAKQTLGRTGRGRSQRDVRHDLRVFALYCQGKDSQAIADQCVWLKDRVAARRAVHRIVLQVRQALGVSPDTPLNTVRKGNNVELAEGDRRRDVVAYNRAYYQRRKAAQKEPQAD